MPLSAFFKVCFLKTELGSSISVMTKSTVQTVEQITFGPAELCSSAKHWKANLKG